VSGVDVLAVMDALTKLAQTSPLYGPSIDDVADKARAAVAELIASGNRVTRAFCALGTAHGVTDTFRAKFECEASMKAFDIALKAVSP